MKNIIVITGAASGFGALAARALAIAGHAVYASMRETTGRNAVLLCHSVPRKDRDRLTSLIRASGSRTPIVSIAGDLGECDAFANATLEDGPNNLLAGIRDVLVKAEKTPAWTFKSGNR